MKHFEGIYRETSTGTGNFEKRFLGSEKASIKNKQVSVLVTFWDHPYCRFFAHDEVNVHFSPAK